MKAVWQPVLILLFGAALLLAGLSAFRTAQVLFLDGPPAHRLMVTAERAVELLTSGNGSGPEGNGPDQASAAVRAAVQTWPLDPGSHFLEFRLARFEGDRARAVQALLRCTQARPADPRFVYSLGIYLLEGGRFGEGLASLKRSLELDSGRVDRVYDHCMDIFAGRYASFPFVFPRQLDVQERLGDLLRASGLLAESIDTFRWCAARAPDSARLHLKLALVHRDAGDFAAALTAVEEVRRLEPDNPMHARYQAEFLLQLGRTAEAMELCRALISARPQAEMAYIIWAQCHERRGEVWEAIGIYRQALWNVPEKGVIHRLLGDRYMEMEWAEQALTEYRNAARLALNDYDRKYALFRIGTCCEVMGLPDAALEALVDAAGISPESTALDQPVSAALERVRAGSG